MSFQTYNYQIQAVNANTTFGRNQVVAQVRDALVSSGEFYIHSENGDANSTTSSYSVNLLFTKIPTLMLQISSSIISLYVQNVSGGSWGLQYVSYQFSQLSNGWFTIKLFVSANFIYLVSSAAVSSGHPTIIKTTKGWLVFSPTGITSSLSQAWASVAYDNEREYYTLIGLGSSFPNMTTMSEHVLTEPFIARRVPRLSLSSGNSFLDSQCTFTGEVYHKPTSLGNLNAGSIYQDSTGKRYIYISMDLLVCD